MKMHFTHHKENEYDKCLKLVDLVRAKIAKIMSPKRPRRYADWQTLRNILRIIDH